MSKENITNKELFEIVNGIFKENWKIDKESLGIYLYLKGLGSEENLEVTIVKYSKEMINVRLSYFFRVGCYCHFSQIFDSREGLVSYLNKINRINTENIEEIHGMVEDTLYTYFSSVVK